MKMPTGCYSFEFRLLKPVETRQREIEEIKEDGIGKSETIGGTKTFLRTCAC